MRNALTDLSVISVAVNLPGPVTARYFAKHGAQVTTLLPPSGDPMEHYSRSLYETLHTGQTITACNLREPDGQEAARALLRKADLLITSSRPRALERMGMDFATTSALNPRLCQVDIVGYPGEGADRPGHDLTYQASEGLVRDALPPTLVSDMVGGLEAFAQALLALRLRDATGDGQRVEVALSAAARFVAQPLAHGLTESGAILGGGNPFYEVYPCADGHVSLAALEPHFQDATVAALGLDQGGDARSQLAEAFARHSVSRWLHWAEEHDIPLHAHS